MGGAALHRLIIHLHSTVSIAGAILWGVLRGLGRLAVTWLAGFNRRGDSLGGAAPSSQPDQRCRNVSIAGAILWGVLRELYVICCYCDRVSIAGAILWGVLLGSKRLNPCVGIVSIAGAILWGVLPRPLTLLVHSRSSFNRRGDSLGGAAIGVEESVRMHASFNRRGDSLGGAAYPLAAWLMQRS